MILVVLSAGNTGTPEAQHRNSTRKEALSAVDAMLNAVQHALRSGDKVVLAGIGSFHVKMRKAKIGRNPKTGVVVPIPPRRAVRFKMSKDLFTKALAESYNQDHA